MERSEPSLVPEWLRNTVGGAGGSSSSHHLATSDGPLLASPKRNRNAKSISNSNGSHSSFIDRSSCNNSRKSSISNGYNNQDKNSYVRSYSGSTRNQRYKDRERLDTNDSWDSECSDSLISIISGRIHKDTLRRSQSMISRRLSESSHCTVFTDLKNNSHDINNGENEASAIATGTTGIQKVSFERDFPMLGSDERPTTPDMSRVSLLRIGKGVQGLPIGISSTIRSEGWTSALAEAPAGSGGSRVSSPPLLDPSPYAAAAAPPATPSITSAVRMSNGLNQSASSTQPPVRPQNASQQSVQSQRFEELPSMGPKRLIPMTPSMPKTLVLNPSDKLKPKTAMKANEAVLGPKNGLQQMSSLQLGSQPVHGGGVRTDGSKSCSSGKLLLLKPARENGLSPSQTTAAVPSVVGNCQSTCAASVASVPLKVSSNVKLADKKCSQAQLQSRNDFFNLVRKKSMSNPSAPADSGMQNSDAQKEIANGPPTPTHGGSEVKCNSIVRDLAESSSNNRENDLYEDAVIHPNEEEEAFLRSLGWEESAADEGGLTEEEINAFVQKLKIMKQSDHMKWKPASKLCQGLQLQISTQSEPQASSPAGASCELRTADSSL